MRWLSERWSIRIEAGYAAIAVELAVLEAREESWPQDVVTVGQNLTRDGDAADRDGGVENSAPTGAGETAGRDRNVENAALAALEIGCARWHDCHRCGAVT